MSLLLDALKKSGQNRQDGETGSHAGTPGALPAEPSLQPAREAGKNLFTAKAAPAEGKMQLGIIPIALIGGAVLAAAGSLYVWHEITPRPLAVRPAPVAKPAPLPAQPPAQTPPPVPQETLADEPPSPPPRTTPAEQEAAGKPAMAEPRIRIQSHQQANSIDPVLASAYQSYQHGDYAAAQRQYAAVLKQDPQNRDALLGIAALAQQQGLDDIAARYYQQVLALDPRDPVAHAGMAALNQDASPTEESRLKLLLAQQPQSAALNFALGNLYAEQQRWAESQQAYFNAYRLQPDSAEYAFNLAVGLDHLGQGKAAAQYYQRALQLDASGTAGFDHALVQRRLNALKAP